MKGRDEHNDIFVADKSEINRCSLDVIAFYFDFQKCSFCPLHYNK